MQHFTIRSVASWIVDIEPIFSVDQVKNPVKAAITIWVKQSFVRDIRRAIDKKHSLEHKKHQEKKEPGRGRDFCRRGMRFQKWLRHVEMTM